MGDVTPSGDPSMPVLTFVLLARSARFGETRQRMPEYDAFGREIGEDTLADTGWSTTDSSGQAASAPVPAPPPPPQAFQTGDPLAPPPPPPPPRPPSPAQQVAEAGFRDLGAPKLYKPKRGLGCGGVVGLVIVLAVIGSVVAGAIAVFNAAETAVDSATDFIPKFPTVTVPGSSGGSTTTESPAEPDKPAKPAKPPVGLRKGSLIKQANFSKAMRQLRAAKLGSLRTLRVAPERIDVQLVTKGGALRSVQLRPGGVLQKFGPATPGFGHLDTFEYSKVNSAAPERLTKAAARKLGKGADGVNYLVLFDFTGTTTWGVFFKNGANFQADGAGNITRRIN